jgi:hypothetical protein
MKRLWVLFPTLYLAFSCSLFAIMEFNLGGWGQRIFFGQKPPYHWVQNNNATEGETYYGANGKDCANVYRFQGTSYTVYGFGFNQDFQTRQQAEAKAEKECR